MMFKKYFITISIFILATASTAHAGSWNGWVYQSPYPTSNTLLSAKFVTPQKGWLAGVHGTILYTEDGGDTWEAQESGVEQDIKCIFFVNDKIGWMVGNGGAIIHTEDGGKKWEKQGDITESLHTVFFVNEREGWAGGGGGTLLHTKDGGKQWSSQSIGTWADIAGIFFINRDTGWVLSGGVIFRTKDGGKGWDVSKLPSVQLPGPRGSKGFVRPADRGWQGNIFFVNDKRGWAVTGLRHVFHTEDGGKTWQDTEISNSVVGISFTDDRNGCAAGTSILCTEDGGKTWKERLGTRPGEQDRIQGYMVSIWGLSFADKTTGWAVGNEGQMWKTEDGGKIWKIQSRGYGRFAHFIDSTTGWNIASDDKPEKSSIVRTDDGGETWKLQKEFEAVADTKFYFINRTTGWVVGQQRKHTHSGHVVINYFILHTNDGGNTWITQFEEKGGQKGLFGGKTGITEGFFDLFFITSSVGWVVGSQGIILHTDDGGKHWEQQKSGTKSELWSVQFVDSKKGWIIGNKITEGSGTPIVLHTDNGGKSWHVQWKKKTDWSWLMGLSFTDEKNGRFMGEIHEYSGDLLFVQTTDGGKTWTEKELPEIFPSKMFFLDANRGVILTEKGQMLITQDGGKTWHKKLKPVHGNPWHVSEIFKEKK